MYNNMMLSEELIKKLREDTSFNIFMEYTQEKMLELDSVANLSGFSNERTGEEVKARALALKKIIDIFKVVWNFNEKVPVSITEKETAKNKFAL